MSYEHDPEAYPDLTPAPPLRPLPDGLTLPRWTANPEAGFIPAELAGGLDRRHMSVSGWHPRNEGEQLEADIQDEVYRLRREARAKRITKEAKKRIRKEGK